RLCFFFSSRRRHTSFDCDWSSDVCSSDLSLAALWLAVAVPAAPYTLAIGALTHKKTLLPPLATTSVPAASTPSVQLHKSPLLWRSEERRVGKECSYRCATDPRKQKHTKQQ